MTHVPEKVLAVRQALARREQLASHTLGLWLDHPGAQSPHEVLTDWEWLFRFRDVRPRHVEVSGWLEDTVDSAGKPQMVAHGGITSISQPAKLEPPRRLYRAAMPGFENRWNWFETFDMAKLVADDRPGGLKIWVCEPSEVFASITIDRTEPGGHRATWNEWVVRPEKVREINRWRDPYTDVPNPESWKKRGVHAIEASSLVSNWFRSTDSKAAPMDREQGGYWLSQFQGIGQFEAFSAWDAADKVTAQTLRVEPATDLQAPGLLYRGAPERLKGRWSWSAEPETAQAFIDLFCPDDGKIWVAEADVVYGVIHAHIDNPEPPLNMSDFTEWIVQPNADSIREWVA